MTGTILWVLWGAEALIVAVMAAVIPTGIAGQPFCEECGYWCEKQPDLFALPGATAAPLVEAVRADSPARVAELRANPPPYDESGLVGVTLHACPGCDQSFADVSHRLSTGKETRVIHLLKLHRISPEMATAMRTAPCAASERGDRRGTSGRGRRRGTGPLIPLDSGLQDAGDRPSQHHSSEGAGLVHRSIKASGHSP